MLKLSCDQTQFLVVSTPQARQYVSDVKLSTSGFSINPTFAATNLGVEIDSALNIYRHVSSLCCGLHYNLSNIARIRPFLGCVYWPNFWLESGFWNAFQANLKGDKRKAFFKGL